MRLFAHNLPCCTGARMLSPLIPSPTSSSGLSLLAHTLKSLEALHLWLLASSTAGRCEHLGCSSCACSKVVKRLRRITVFHPALTATQTQATVPRAFGLPALSGISCVASCGPEVQFVFYRQALRMRQAWTSSAFD